MFGARARVGAGTVAGLAVVAVLVLALSAVQVGVTFAVPGVIGEHAARDIFVSVASALAALSFVPVGIVVIVRGGNRRVGWLLLCTGLAIAFDLAAAAYGQGYTKDAGLPFGRWAAWLDDFAWMVMTVAIWLIVVVFPDGRVATRTGRWVVAWFVLGTAVGLSSLPFHSGHLYDQPGLTTPLPHLLVLTSWGDTVPPEVVGGFLVSGFCLAMVEGVHRYRIAGRVQRAQQRWLAWAFATVVVIYLSHFLPVVGQVMSLFTLASIPILPLAVGTAMFRERLYDIDRIVSRTVGYGLVTGLLAGLYAAIVTSVSALAPDRLGTLGVAVATLVVAALFVPARRRVQDRVDRRFNRAHFSARRVAEGFGALARTEPDVQVVGAELLRVVDDTLAPERAGLWLAR